jgi:hypothetical protein
VNDLYPHSQVTLLLVVTYNRFPRLDNGYEKLPLVPAVFQQEREPLRFGDDCIPDDSVRCEAVPVPDFKGQGG